MDSNVEVVIPVLGDGIDAVKIIAVLIQEGDTVSANQNIVEVESEKANLEIPSPMEGKVQKIHAQPGQTMQIGESLLTLVTVSSQATGPSVASVAQAQDSADSRDTETSPAEAASDLSPPTPAEPPAEAASDLSPPTPAEPPAEAALIPASPSVRRFAREIGLDIRQVIPNNPDGRIRLEDVKQTSKRMLQNLEVGSGAGTGMATASSVDLARLGEPKLPDFSKWGTIRSEKLETIRLKTAEHMNLAHQVIPQVTQYDESNISELEKFRKQVNKKLAASNTKLTITAIICKVLSLALQRMPKFNASIDMSQRKMIFKDYFHIAIAVDTPHGLLVPVVQDVDQKDLQTVAMEINELAKLARQKKLRPKQMQGGTITITNLGGLGTTYFTPIVNWPQVAILGLGRAKQQPYYNESKERFEPQLTMPLSISYDHRAIDGAEAARFLRWICEAMEHPLNILLA